jgi:predicted unusual protein kinase regulating ubiquinone biosynthesis (AarF/ABC1/UbiB family)
MKTKTKAFILLLNEIHNNNIYLYNNLIMFGRFFYLFYIFISETIKFNFNNLIYLIYKLPKLERLELVKSITYKLEDLNIVYVKIFQSLCLEKDILYPNEKDYLLKYTDNVPYTSDEVDYELLDLMESKYNIRLEDGEAINSGIIGIVFKGLDGNKNDSKVVIKILKNNIEKKLNAVFNEIECLTSIISYIPFLNNLNLHKLFLDNKESLLNQINFVKEVTNIEIFKLKNQNLPEYRIPHVYKEITNIYNNVIVMENIKGLTINDLQKLDSNIKEEFAKLFQKFGLLSILYNSAIHNDLHAGNVFFYINNINLELPKYQLGLIDFGICCFPNKNNQNSYYYFFYEMNINKKFDDKYKLDELLSVIIEEKDKLNKFKNNNTKQYCFFREKIVNILKKYSNIDLTCKFLIDIAIILKKNNFNLSKEFNEICLGLKTVESVINTLSLDNKKIQNIVMQELIQINKLIEI